VTRTYVVTGGASGIGLATVEQLATLGHRTITVDRAGADVNADLSGDAGRTQMVAEVDRLTGGVVDAVVACAGTVNQGRTDVQVNYFGAVATLEGLRPMLAAGTDPRAVAVSSVAVLDQVDPALVEACLDGDEPAALAAVDALAPAARMQTYSSSKRALARWVRRVAPTAPWAGAGIPINTIGPGVVRTPMTEPLLADERMAEQLLAMVPMPLGGILAPEAIAHLLVQLTDPLILGMTGQTIFVDGGGETTSRGDDIY
jgi:NAD(P)-dependent dehydrogenase (short-subunit alcohol dehydrogenase family)